MVEQLTTVGLELVGSVLVALLGVLGAYVLYHIGNVAKALQEKSKNEHVDAVIDRLHRLTITTVTAAEAQGAKIIRAAVAEGRITKEAGREELRELGNDALGRVKDELGDKALSLLDEQRVDVDAIISDILESAVEKIKSPLANGS